MKFSIFPSAKSSQGNICTHERYLETANSDWLLRLCNDIAAEEDSEKRAELKKKLPVVTWQAYFAGKRVNKEAQPSGLFMLDIDHVDKPGKLFAEKVVRHIKELGIVYVGATASRHGLRIVAKCLPTLHTIEECQRWLASNLKVEFDGVCKDWARCSFLVHDSYTYFMDAKAIWQEEPAEGTVYAGGLNPVQENAEMSKMLQEAEKPTNAAEDTQQATGVDQREGLFGGSDTYKGVPYAQICKEWLEATGGEPTQGERNTRVFQLALRMRYICDFNEATLARILPDYGMKREEVAQIAHSALGMSRAGQMPRDLEDVLKNIDRRIKLGVGKEDEEVPEIITDAYKMPQMPPIIKEWVDNAPDDFKAAVALCQLPILGTLASRLRGKYLDGQVHSPSFLVSLEAAQASGKSFMVKMAESELAQIIEHDELERSKEREYSERAAEMKMLNIKVTVENKDQILGTKPKAIVRYVPATMSTTKLLMRMDNAQGLHLFALAEEVDTVVKAFKRSFSSYSDLLRVAFDNGLYGQDYASDNSFSGTLRLYYNMLCSGTPKAMCRMYPDVEDGTTSRVLFVTLPDQFGKPLPVWTPFSDEQQQSIDINLVRLNEISIQGSEVMPEHVMNMDFLNKALDAWLVAQKQEAVRTNDRTRDIFCRRAAVVGFRAGLIAYYLWGEDRRRSTKNRTCKFAIWVANCMLNQHLLRFNIKQTHSNVNQWEEVYNALPDEFTRDEVEQKLREFGVESTVKFVLYKWRLGNIIEETQKGRTASGQKASLKFKKIH